MWLSSSPRLGKRNALGLVKKKEGDRCSVRSARVICVNALSHADSRTALSHAAGGQEWSRIPDVGHPQTLVPNHGPSGINEKAVYKPASITVS